MSKKPNILVFCVDEMRADHMGCAGNPVVKTPNLDRLAARGALFRRGYCNNPICMPARTTMFTGLLPRDHGVRVNGQMPRRDLPCLPQVLSDAGYRTHAAGKLHLTPYVPKVLPPAPHAFPECLDYWKEGLLTSFPTPYFGFQSVDFVGGHTSYAFGPYHQWLKERGGCAEQLTARKAIGTPRFAPDCYKMSLPEELHYNRFIADSTRQLIRESAQPGAAPFFAWCSFPDPHCPVAPPAPYCDLYSPADVQLPARRDGELDDLPPVYKRILSAELKPNGTNNSRFSDDLWREMIALTFGMITHVDTEIGRVLATLEETGQADNTVIVFISDHGDMMGDHNLLWKSFYTFEGCVRLPLIVTAPGMPGGIVSDALVGQIDLMPTILDLCGLPMPGEQWREVKTPFDRGTVMPLQLYPGRSWRPLLFSERTELHPHIVIENDDPTTGYKIRCLVTPTHKITLYPGTSDGELYDLERDPHELRNLWYKPECARLRLELLAQLLDAYSLATPSYPVPPWNS